jgi:hypothetical protein
MMKQLIVLILGGLFATAGVILFALKGTRGKNTIKMLGMEFQLAGSSLVVFALGCVLILAALRLDGFATGEEKASPSAVKTNAPATPPSPPEFVTRYVYPPQAVERVQFDTEAGRLPAAALDGFLTLTRMAYGHVPPTNQVFQVELTLKNTGATAILLDLSDRFFVLEDDKGRRAELLYFCCAANGDVLPAGAERTMQLFFRAEGWHGKNLGARWIFLRVNGLLPVVSASWKAPVLATAN